MLLQTYVKITLLLTGVSAGLRRHAEAKRPQDDGLATLEWVALAIVAVGLAAVAGAGIKLAIQRKIDAIP
jgi:hypothetical protein